MAGKIVSLTLAIWLILGVSVGAGTYSGGDGSEGNPYKINTAEDMNEIGANVADWASHFVMVNDINLAQYTGTEFSIIGNNSNVFTGVFDGNSHTISNFTYSSTGTDYIGIFGYVNGADAEIKHLGIINPSVDTGTGDKVGLLVGRLYRGSITSCYTEGGSISGDNVVGGLVGETNGGSQITNCYTSSSVSGDFVIAGLAGISFAEISNCYSNSNVSATYDIAGGLVAENYGPISDCHTSGNIEGVNGIGGLIGGTDAVAITHCYSSAYVVGTGVDIGALIGSDYGSSYEKCFWDSTINSGLNGIGDGTVDPNVIGKSTTEMYTQNTFTNWDFITPAWWICEEVGYPMLRWEEGKYGGGCGTDSDPFLIYTAIQLNDIGADSNDWDRQFRLMADIDLSDFNGLNSKPSFNTIGNSTIKFTSVFDGNDHTISNFIHNKGLFGQVEGADAEIKKLGLITPDINSETGDSIGALIGWLKDGCVSGCYVEDGNVSGRNYVGGLIGQISDGLIINCRAVCEVGGSQQIGGLVGRNFFGTIYASYSEGNVIGTGDFYAGGLLGVNIAGTVSNCYSKANISGVYVVGGLIGGDSTTSKTVINCYSVGTVNGTSGLGAFLGSHIGGTYEKCFWDSSVNPDVNGIGNTTDPNVIGETTANMKTESTFADEGWDFLGETINGPNDIWRMCVDGVDYPLLSWQFNKADFVCPDGVDFFDFAVLADQWRRKKISFDLWPSVGDGVVDFSDWAVVADNWDGTQEKWVEVLGFAAEWLAEGRRELSADVVPSNGDGIVNWRDVEIFGNNWLEGI